MCGICFTLTPASPPPTHENSSSTTQSTLVTQLQSINLSPSIPESDQSTSSDIPSPDEIWETLTEAVSSRGPDYKGSLHRTVDSGSGDVELRFHAAILHMRGRQVTKQPFVAENGDIFLWNGEIFDGLDVGAEENDGQILFERILNAETGSEGFIRAIRDVEGPYAFVYYQATTNHLYYGRDPLGRRSLLLHRPTTSFPSFYLTSNGPAIDHPLNEFEEVSAGEIFRYNLSLVGGMDWHADSMLGLSSYPRVPKSSATDSSTLIYPFNRLSTRLPLPSDLLPFIDVDTPPLITPPLRDCLDTLLRELRRAVRARVALLPLPSSLPSSASTTPGEGQKKARVAILFSGGLDCTTLALLASDELPPDESIDLINVAFENPRVLAAVKPRKVDEEKNRIKRERIAERLRRRGGVPLVAEELVVEKEDVMAERGMYDVPDRLTGYESYEELRKLRPGRQWNFVEVNVEYEEMLRSREKVIELMRPAKTVMDLSISLAFYFACRSIGTLSTSPSSPSSPYISTAKILLSGLGADELFGGYARHRKTFFYNPPTPTSPSAPYLALLSELQMDLDRIPYRNLGRDDRIISSHGKEARYPFLAGNVVEVAAEMSIWLKCDMRFGEGVGDKLMLRALAGELGLRGARGLKKRAIHFGARTAKMELNSGKDRGEMSL